jgi:hypothetical protein
MCDYSLHNVASRPARIGDRLVSSTFPNTITRGFTASDEPGVAVCLLPGTELAFESDVEGCLAQADGTVRKFGHKLARFRQADLDNPVAHHDALEFPGGESVLLTNLVEGQLVTVLQLPPRAYGMHGDHGEAPALTHDTLVASGA